MDDVTHLKMISDIKSCKARYVRALDSRDIETFSGLFTENAVWDLSGILIARHVDGSWNGHGSEVALADLQRYAASFEWPVTGRGAIKDAMEKIDGNITMFHGLFAPVIDCLSSDHARATWPFEDMLLFSEDAPLRSLNGRGCYFETYRQVEGRWLIESLRVEYRFATILGW